MTIHETPLLGDIELFRGENRFPYSSLEVEAERFEARRNYNHNPLLRGSVAYWATTPAVATMTPTPAGARIDVTTITSAPLIFNSANISVSASDRWSASLVVEVPAGYPALTLSLRVYSYGENLAVSTSGDITVQPGTTVTLEAPSRWQVSTESTGIRTILYAVGVPPGARLLVRDALMEKVGRPGAFFGGPVSNDPDYISSWEGVVDGSTTVATAGRASGVNQAVPANTRVVHSVHWAKSGQKSVRVIPLTEDRPITYGSVSILDLTPGQTYTATAVMHLDAPQTGVLDSRARRLMAQSVGMSPNNILSEPAPNEAGDHTLRVTFTLGSATSAILFFYNGSSSQDVWVDDIRVYEGTGFIPDAKRITAHRGAARIDLGQKVDVGLMSFELHNAEDPLAGGTFKPGQKVTALAGGRPIFTGKVADVASVYPLNKLTGQERTHVAITVADAVQPLSTHMRYGVTSAEGYETFESRIERYALNAPVPVEAPAEGGPREVYAF